MADQLRYDDLRQLSIDKLEGRIKQLQDAQKNTVLTADRQSSLSNAIDATRCMLEMKRLKSTTLLALANDKGALKKTYMSLTVSELMDTYDLHVRQQRRLFEDYADDVLQQMEILKRNWDYEDCPDGPQPEALTSRLANEGLPELTDIFESLTKLPLTTCTGCEKTTLKDVMEERSRRYDD